MKIYLTLLTTLALAGCAKFATVKVIKPQLAGFTVKTSTDPLVMIDEYVGAAETAWHKLERNPADDQAMRDYNFAVSRICGTLRTSKLTPWTAPIRLASHTLAWEHDSRPERNPSKYDFIPSDELKITGKYMDVREVKAGIGAPLVAKRIADQVHELAPTPHFYYNVTATANFVGSRCVISIDEPLEQETVRVGQRTWPLAADYTAPLAMMLVEMEPEKLNIPRLLHPAEFAATTRIARLEPYNPNKTVVLLVHGLASSPTTWFPLLNHLRGDPEIRDHYQFWFYSYPSGYPYPYSAAILRQELDQAEKRYPSKKKMVVIGHSMGGCISRVLITDSGHRIWDKMFTVPPEKMDVSSEDKHILTESSIFSHRPEIGRVIFISTPHRGSDLATNWLGQAFTRLVKLPATMVSIGLDDARYQRSANGLKHISRFPDSVDTLAPNNDFVVALNEIPISPDIPYHTIAGDRGKGDSPNSSDGVVPYWSSHQSGARSELVVPSHHGAHQTSQAIAEVDRILRENLKSSR
ncbi:MAG: alpha/beta fold hydrolase [Luteolibacter sp.]|uniref:esterase/lipase family protein n=1 Tax=Luteolibacter sp. TaxID=1962973 RepID=UPI003267339F